MGFQTVSVTFLPSEVCLLVVLTDVGQVVTLLPTLIPGCGSDEKAPRVGGPPLSYLFRTLSVLSSYTSIYLGSVLTESFVPPQSPYVRVSVQNENKNGERVLENKTPDKVYRGLVIKSTIGTGLTRLVTGTEPETRTTT